MPTERRRSRVRHLVLLSLSLFWLSAIAAAAVSGGEGRANEPGKDDGQNGDRATALARKVRASVVVIRTSDRTGESFGVGSGFIVDTNGLIATNFHVIGEGRRFTIKMSGDRELEPLAIVAADRKKDIALIRVNASDLPALELGDSDAARPGQSVIAVGNPLGFDFSVSKGVVAQRRDLDGREMIQVAMPIEPGNSGSALVDEKGRVLGIIAIKSSPSLGFAVPINDLKALIASPRPMSYDRWLTIGALDAREWKVLTKGGDWRQRAGRLVASGEGSGFGGRMICLSKRAAPDSEFELAVDVKLSDESGAAGLVFRSDGGDRHYGFYPTGASLRLTRFEGPTVFTWTILDTLTSEHYRQGEWNRIKVRVARDQITCYVNDEPVIDLADASLTTGTLAKGSVGVCKFRTPEAEFRNFQIAAALPSRRLDLRASARVHELVSSVSPTGPPDDAIVDELSTFGPGGLRAIDKRMRELEAEAFRLGQLTKLVHQRGIERELTALFAKPDGEVDLVQAALLVAKLDNRELDVAFYMRSIDRLVADLRQRFDAAESEERHVEQLVSFFVEDLGFRGGRSEYYHRSNSYLNEVLDDREGLPITLSVIFIELARRVRLPIVGLGIPRHFVVQHRPESGTHRMFDVFDGGKLFSIREARELSGVALEASDLVPATKRSIIIRMLRNLSNVAVSSRDVPAVLRYHDVILRLDENAAVERWQRAVLRWQTAQPRGAASDLDWLLENQPDGIDLREVRQLRQSLSQQGY